MSADSPESGDRTQAIHRPVLLQQSLQMLDLHPGMIVVDGTVGAGGHSKEILNAIGKTGKLIGLDRDPFMLNFARENLPQTNCILEHASYADLSSVLHKHAITHVDRILVDLGLSSDQLADRRRGFGFQTDSPLDMRFDNTTGRSAAEILASASAAELQDMFVQFGEEKYSSGIAKAIVNTRNQNPLQSTSDLTELIKQTIPPSALKKARTNPATRIFQALRIAANRELEHLQRALQQAFPDSLHNGGLLAVITFHSLEDRIVKQAFREKNTWENLTRKPITARPAEIRINPRSRSAKLRVARKS